MVGLTGMPASDASLLLNAEGVFTAALAWFAFKENVDRRIAIGMLWGWLPCGLSATLLATAWLQASSLNGALTMTAFGLGTLPIMLPLTWSGARLGQRLQRGGVRIAAGALVLFAGLVTLAAPWLMQVPALHGVLSALGCRTLPM